MTINSSDYWRTQEPHSHKLAILFRACRRDADMSLKDVKAALPGHLQNVTVSYLSDFERGKLTPPLDVLAALFLAVGYTLAITATPLPEEND